MRYKIWIALIVCGTLTVLAPPLSDYLADRQISQILVERKDFTNFNFGIRTPGSDVERIPVWLLGPGRRDDFGGNDRWLARGRRQ